MPLITLGFTCRARGARSLPWPRPGPSQRSRLGLIRSSQKLRSRSRSPAPGTRRAALTAVGGPCFDRT
eukprot:9868261-Alexandrium_andersonii.AAC.1